MIQCSAPPLAYWSEGYWLSLICLYTYTYLYCNMYIYILAKTYTELPVTTRGLAVVNRDALWFHLTVAVRFFYLKSRFLRQVGWKPLRSSFGSLPGSPPKHPANGRFGGINEATAAMFSPSCSVQNTQSSRAKDQQLRTVPTAPCLPTLPSLQDFLHFISDAFRPFIIRNFSSPAERSTEYAKTVMDIEVNYTSQPLLKKP